MSRALALLRALPECGRITAAKLALAAGLPRDTVPSVADKLKRRGYLEKLGGGCYALTAKGRTLRDSGIENLRRTKRGPRRGPPAQPRGRSARDKAWWHLRNLRKATLSELLRKMGAPDSARDSVGTFLKALGAAGYLGSLRRNASGPIAWVLVRNTGPQTPVVQRARAHVWDPNERQYYPMAAP